MTWGNVGIFVFGLAVGLVFWGVIVGRFIGQVRLVTAAMNNQIKAIDEREARRQREPDETMTEYIDELKARREKKESDQ